MCLAKRLRHTQGCIVNRLRAALLLWLLLLPSQPIFLNSDASKFSHRAAVDGFVVMWAFTMHGELRVMDKEILAAYCLSITHLRAVSYEPSTGVLCCLLQTCLQWRWRERDLTAIHVMCTVLGSESSVVLLHLPTQRNSLQPPYTLRTSKPSFSKGRQPVQVA